MSASDYSYITIFEGILLYAAEVREMTSSTHLFMCPFLQAPTYHIILEVVLVLWIIKLLFFTQKYHPNATDKPTSQVGLTD